MYMLPLVPKWFGGLIISHSFLFQSVSTKEFRLFFLVSPSGNKKIS